MRILTILFAIGFGMVLSWVMLLNQHPVKVVLESGHLGWIDPAVRTMPLWQVIFSSVAIGLVIGLIISRGLGADRRRRLRELEYEYGADADLDEEPDYVVGLSKRK